MRFKSATRRTSKWPATTARASDFPSDLVDVENGGTPVGIDTAGNVEQSIYEHNRFEEIDGKCIDLDGFHDGAVRGNTCINRRPPEDYPFGHFGIVFNNCQYRDAVAEYSGRRERT